MRILLDTHTFLWFIAGDTRLDVYARRLIEEPHNERYHHKDPFDRLIVAQAMQEGMLLVTKDQAFGAYNVRVAWSSP